MKRMRVTASLKKKAQTPNDGVHATVRGVYNLHEEVFRQMGLTIPGTDTDPDDIHPDYQEHWNYMDKVVKALDPLLSEGIRLEEKLGLWNPDRE